MTMRQNRKIVQKFLFVQQLSQTPFRFATKSIAVEILSEDTLNKALYFQCMLKACR